MRVTVTRGGVPAFLRRLFAGLDVRAGALREDTRVKAVRIGQPRRHYIWRVAPGIVDLPVRLVSVAAYQPADSRSPSPQVAAATTGDHLFCGTSWPRSPPVKGVEAIVSPDRP